MASSGWYTSRAATAALECSMPGLFKRICIHMSFLRCPEMHLL